MLDYKKNGGRGPEGTRKRKTAHRNSGRRRNWTYETSIQRRDCTTGDDPCQHAIAFPPHASAKGDSVPQLKKTGIIHPTLTGYDFREDEPLQRARAIRMKCLECCGGDSAKVRHCEITDYPLWPWRSGKQPSQNAQEGQKRPPQSRSRAERSNNGT